MTDKQQHWTFIRDGVPEKILLDKWMWAVMYKDGTELHQFDDNGIFHQIGEVDSSQVKMLTLYEPEGDGRIDIAFPEGAKVVHKVRVFTFEMLTEEERKVRIFCIGYKLRDQHHLTWVLPDGRLVVSADDTLNLTEYGI